jgi:hypothetical protein
LFDQSNSNLTLSNTGGGSITGTGSGVAGVYVGTSIGSITNGVSSSITGLNGADGIRVSETGSVNAISNAGSVSGDVGIYVNLGSVNSISNTGVISGAYYDAIGLYGVGSTTLTLSNTNGGSITGSDSGVYVGASIESITNGVNSSIAGDFGDGILVDGDIGGAVNTINNAGTISGNAGIAVYWAGSVNAIVNTGTITGTYDGIGLYSLGNTNLTLSNTNGGTITGSDVGDAGVYIDAAIESITNGVGSSITGLNGADGIYAAASVNTISNAGTIHGLAGGSGIVVDGSLIGGITNQVGGVISGELAAIRVIAGGGVDMITNAGTITGSAGTAIDLTDAIGPTTINNTGTINGAVLLGSGTLNMNTGSIVAGAISGTGTLNVNTDFTTQGNVSASLIALATGKTLTAANAVTASSALTNAGTLNITAGQTVSAGSYAQSASGVLKVGASSATNHGTLAVVGTADFSASGAIAVNVSAGDSIVNNDVLHIVTAGTLTSPTSYSVTDNSALWNFTAVDNGTNGIDLTAHFGSLTTAVQAAAKPAAAGVAGALNAILTGTTPASMQPLASGLNTQTNLVSLGNQVAQLTPVLSGGQGVAALASINAGASSLVQSQIATTLGLSSGDAVQDQHVWVKPFGSNLKQDTASSGMPGYKAVTSGVAVGADRRLENSDWRAGFALSYGTSKVEDSGTSAGVIDISSWQVTGYGSHRINGEIQLNLMGGVGFNDNKSSRYVPLVATTYAGKYNSWHGLLDAELEWANKVSESNTLIPSARLSYSTLQSDSYTETPSGNAALKVASNTTESLVLGLGAKFVHSLENQGRWIGHVEAGYDLVEKSAAQTSTFAGGGPSFVTSGTTPSRTLLKAGLAYQQVLSNGSEVTARFDTESRDLFSANSLSVNWRLPF